MRIKLVQGSTFIKKFRWEAEPFIYRPIQVIDNSAPCLVHCLDHGLKDNQLFVIQAAKGLESLNATEPAHLDTDWRRGRFVDKDTIEINRLNASLLKPHTAGTGNIKYRTVVDLTGFTARMSIRDRAGAVVLHDMSTTDGSIVLDPLTGYIQLVIPESATKTFEWKRGMYDLELVDADGRVFKVISGDVTVDKEYTKTV